MPPVSALSALKDKLLKGLDHDSDAAFDLVMDALKMASRGGVMPTFELTISIYNLIEARLRYHLGKQGD